MKKLLYKFIWDGKPEKIKRDILTMGYESGGLKMIDLGNFINSLKICWIKQLIEADNDAILNKIYINNLSSFGRKLLFECNISEDDICKITHNRFLNDVLLLFVYIDLRHIHILRPFFQSSGIFIKCVL